MNSSARTGVISVVLVTLSLAATACSGGDDATAGPSTASPSVARSSTSQAVAGPREATCTLDGPAPMQATLRDTGAALVVTWSGQPLPPQGKAGYFVEVGEGTRPDGSRSDSGVAELGIRFVDGRQTEAYVYVAGAGTQVDQDATVTGSSVTARFTYADVGEVASRGIGEWTAMTSRGERTSGECTADLALLPFPG